jgi:hypothetical protein
MSDQITAIARETFDLRNEISAVQRFRFAESKSDVSELITNEFFIYNDYYFDNIHAAYNLNSSVSMLHE